MKFSFFPAILTLIVSLAIAYLAYHLVHKDSNPHDVIVGVGTFLSSILTLGCMMGVSFTNSRMNINLKVWSGVAFLIMSITNFCFAGFGVSMPYYIIFLALLLVIHIGIVWKMYKINDV